VRQGQFGVNVEPGNAAALAKTLQDLALQPAELKERGRAGRAYVKQFERGPVMERFHQKLSALTGDPGGMSSPAEP